MQEGAPTKHQQEDPEVVMLKAEAIRKFNEAVGNYKRTPDLARSALIEYDIVINSLATKGNVLNAAYNIRDANQVTINNLEIEYEELEEAIRYAALKEAVKQLDDESGDEADQAKVEHVKMNAPAILKQICFKLEAEVGIDWSKRGKPDRPGAEALDSLLQRLSAQINPATEYITQREIDVLGFNINLATLFDGDYQEGSNIEGFNYVEWEMAIRYATFVKIKSTAERYSNESFIELDNDDERDETADPEAQPTPRPIVSRDPRDTNREQIETSCVFEMKRIKKGIDDGGIPVPIDYDLKSKSREIQELAAYLDSRLAGNQGELFPDIDASKISDDELEELYAFVVSRMHNLKPEIEKDPRREKARNKVLEKLKSSYEFLDRPENKRLKRNIGYALLGAGIIGATVGVPWLVTAAGTGKLVLKVLTSFTAGVGAGMVTDEYLKKKYTGLQEKEIQLIALCAGLCFDQH